MKLNRWSQVQNLLDRFKCTYYYDSSEKDSIPNLLQHALIFLKKPHNFPKLMTHLMIRGTNTNNCIEVTFRLLKDIAL